MKEYNQVGGKKHKHNSQIRSAANFQEMNELAQDNQRRLNKASHKTNGQYLSQQNKSSSSKEFMD